jgi:hypothetical protein
VRALIRDILQRDAIPLGSRIIAMADAVDRIANNSHTRAKNNYQKALDEVEQQLDREFDRKIFPFLRQVVQERIRTIVHQDFSVEIEVHPERLRPGMVLSRDVRSGSGMLILAQGIILDPKIIHSIQRYYQIDPPQHGVFIIKNSA